MNKKTLGKTPITIAPLFLGGNVFGWTADEASSFSILDAFLDAGFNAIDTANVYSKWVPGHKGGESETVLGKWFSRSGKRKDVILATKVGGAMGEGANEKGLKKDHILKAVEDSLSRLQTDYIDLYQTHFDEPETPVEETLEAYAELVKAGKVRYIGASNITPARLEESLRVSDAKGYPRYQTLQPLYNLMEREAFEKELGPICQREGLGVIPYFSLAAGFLTGKYRTEEDLAKSPRGQGVKKYLNEKGLGVLKALDEVSARRHSDPASVALAWLLTRPVVTAPIASATTLTQLKSLLSGVQLELHADDVEQLDKASAWR
jgi:aryl-alcohol dehydrogenase-like predicted oxidoreductase